MKLGCQTMMEPIVLALGATLHLGARAVLAQVERARIKGTVSNATGTEIPAGDTYVTHLQANRPDRH